MSVDIAAISEGLERSFIAGRFERTDKWILSQFKQLRTRSLMIVIGNHGRYKIDLNYQGKVAEWRAASVPLAVFLYKA